MSQEIKPVIELLNNMLFLAAAYNQIWTIRAISLNNETSIAIIEEETNKIKMLFHNPDKLMSLAIAEIEKIGWHETKQKYLAGDAFAETRVSLIEK